MTIEEMHIAVNLGVQKIGSFQVDNLLPEEIDHELNMAQRRFIKQRYSTTSNQKGTGFEQSQKRIDDLRTLIEDYSTYETFYMGPTYTSSSKGVIFTDRVKMPIDYMHLINIRTIVYHDCSGPISADITRSHDHYLRIPIITRDDGYVFTEIQLPNSTGQFLSIKNNPNGLTIDDLREDSYAGDVEPSLSPNDTYSDLTSNKKSTDSPHADGNEIYLKLTSTTNSTKDGFFRYAADDSNFNGAFALLIFTHPITGLRDTIGVMGQPFTLTTFKRKFVSEIVSGGSISVKQTLCKYVQHDDLYKVLDLSLIHI